jgi:DNA primase
MVDDEPTAKTDNNSMIQLQERETIRLLLNYAESNYEEQRVIDFLMAELEDVEFISPLYKEIYLIFKKGLTEGHVIDTFYFMENSSEQIRGAVTELMTTRYETSKSWSEKYRIYFPHEKEILHEVAYSNVLRLKFRLIQKLIDENLGQMKLAKTEPDLEKYFTIHEQLKNAEKELASVLGIVVAR